MKYLKILNWNILSPHLIEYDTNFFPKKYYSKTTTSKNSRLKLFIKLLNQHIDTSKPNLISFQEVPSIWYVEIFSILREYGYDSIHTTYGSDTREMGIVLAWKSHYVLENIEIQKVGDLIPQKSYKDSKSQKKDREYAIGKLNKIIFVSLRYGSKKMLFGSYHMPCSFKYPFVMHLHAYAITSYVDKLSKKYHNNIILTTDLNAKPESETFRIMSKKLQTVTTKPTTYVVRKDSLSGKFVEFNEIIDYVWVKKDSYTLSNQIVLSDNIISPNSQNSSDHFPILMKLKI